MDEFGARAAEIAAVTAAIRENPADELSRGALVDLLREAGEEEFADWWAGGARAWLEGFAARVGLTFDQVVTAGTDWIAAGAEPSVDEEGYRTGVETEEQLRSWRRACWFARGDLQHDPAADAMENPTTGTSYWRALEVVLGRKIAGYDKASYQIFSCTC